MKEPRRYEIWRADYVKDAYADQTGMTHWGYIVYDQLVLTETGSFPVQEPYSQKWFNDAGVIAVTDTGLEFRGVPNLTDYSGGMGWTPTKKVDGLKGYWMRAPYTSKGYVHPDGSPVAYLLVRDHP